MTDQATVKPGYRTSEFWISLATTLLGAVVGSGVIPGGSIWAQIAGIAASAIASSVYSKSRADVKTAQ